MRWRKIAERYKNEPVILGYELFNEPIAPYFPNMEELNGKLEDIYKKGMIQAEPEATKNLESLNSIKIRNGNEMAPISQFVSIKKVYGPDVISRFNLYTAIKVMVAPASGYTSGQALQAIAEVAKESLPTGYGYELGGMAREEASTSGSSTGIIFILCFVFVYLLLSAQYESYILPLSVLLSVPFGLLGSFLFVNGFAALGNIPALKMILGTMSNDIYMPGKI